MFLPVILPYSSFFGWTVSFCVIQKSCYAPHSSLVGGVKELWPFLVALFVSLLQFQTCFSLQAVVSVTKDQ